MKRFLFPCLTLALVCGQSYGQEKKIVSFSALEGPSVEAVKSQAAAWLKQAGKTDAASVKAFDAIWTQEDRTILDRVADSLVLGSDAANKLLQEARNESAPAPVKTPEVLQDAKQPAFLRANLEGYADYRARVPYRLVPGLW